MALITVLVSSGAALANRADINLQGIKFPKFDLKLPDLSVPETLQNTSSLESTITTTRANPSPTRTVLAAPTARPTARPCLRFTVLHLDGSSSNLCYSQADYGQLVNLSYDLSSAQTFYKFQLDAVSDYQAEYERTGSAIYLNAKASAQAKADEHKVKIDQTLVKMYNLEQKGY